MTTVQWATVEFGAMMAIALCLVSAFMFVTTCDTLKVKGGKAARIVYAVCLIVALCSGGVMYAASKNIPTPPPTTYLVCGTVQTKEGTMVIVESANGLGEKFIEGLIYEPGASPDFHVGDELNNEEFQKASKAAGKTVFSYIR